MRAESARRIPGMNADESGRVPTSADECRRAPTSADEYRRAPTSTDEHRRAPTSTDEHRRARTSADEYRRVPTSADERGRTRTNADERGRTRTNACGGPPSREPAGPLPFAQPRMRVGIRGRRVEPNHPPERVLFVPARAIRRFVGFPLDPRDDAHVRVREPARQARVVFFGVVGMERLREAPQFGSTDSRFREVPRAGRARGRRTTSAPAGSRRADRPRGSPC
ncbi:hypothetical protein NCV_06136 [Burkholderia pseudomallei]